MSDSRLLPTGSSPLEVAAAKACAEIEKTPVSIRELWNPDTHQRPEAAKAEGKTETQKERETPARTGAPESETGHAEESAKSTGSARR